MAAPQTAVQIGVEYVDPKNSLVRNADQQSRAAANVIRNNLGGVTREFSNAGGAVRQFDQQLERANKRVLALGASVTVLYGTINAFKQLVAVTTQVEKNLVEINSIFQLNTRDLDKFGKTLLNVAQQTGQSLDQVANAAKEFSRQGLGVEETAKRTRDAMILVRLTGLEATKSVDLLTAAMNTFGKTGADTTNILNKLVAVDRAFAVSSKDIAEALARVGSVVDDANISLDQFAGLVTAARQITSREGAVIGNSLKTIFTRLERSSTLDQLESFGIAVRDASGNAKSAIDVFNSLASSYGRLNREQQQQVTELAAGVFQINQFKALLLDLGKANGIAAQATSIATKATNEALIANAALNDSLSASIQRLQNSATQAASVVGNIAVAPALKTAMGGINLITESIAELSSTGATKAGEDFGKYLGESILKGVGNVLAGPGLIFLARSAFGIASRSLSETFSESRQAASIAPRAFGRFTGRGEEQSLQMVNTLLDQGTAKERQRFAAAKAVAEQEAIILSIMQRQAAVGATLGGAAPAVTSLRGRRVPGAAGGYLPMSEERAAISAGVGGAPSSARPVYLPNFNRGRGQRGIVANSSEWMVPGAAGGAIYNQDMIRKYGLPPGATPVAAGGYVPNAAFGSFLGMPGMGSPYDYPQRILRNPVSTPATGFPTASGQGFGQYTQNIQQGNAAVGQIGILFQQLSKAANTLEASKIGPQIIDLAKSLDKVSERQVLRDLANVFNALPMRTQAVQNANIVMGGVATNPAYAAAQQVISKGGDLSSSPDYYRVNRIDIARGLVDPRTGLPTEEEQKRIEADLRRDQQIFQARQELRNKQAADERRARLERRSTNLQIGLAGGSFAAGFIPDLPGGTLQAQAAGGLSGGVQGAAIGSAAGAFFGPIGVIAGSIIGGLGGAVKGFIEKSSKSFEELAKEISDANSRTVQVIAGASQFRNLQGNIQEAIERGQSGDVINALFRQQRAASAQLPASVLRDLLEAGFDSEKQSAVFSKLAATQEEQTAAGALRIGLHGLADPSKLGEGGIGAVAASLRSVYSGGGDNLSSLLGRLKKEGYGGANAYSLTGDTLSFSTDFQGVTDQDLRAELLNIIAKSKLSPSEIEEYAKYAKDAKGKVLIDLLTKFQESADTGPLLDISKRSTEQLSSLRTQFGALIRGERRNQALGAVSGQFQNRLTGLRERAALGLGGLTESGSLELSGRFALASTQREAQLSNSQAFQAAKVRFSEEAYGLGSNAELSQRILSASGPEALEAIVSSFKGNEIQNKLTEVVSELKVTIAQNETMVALTKEDNRLNQLQLEAQQQQRLLSAGTFTGSTGATARSLFSRFRGSSGTAQSVNAINLSSFLGQVGLPQTEEGQFFDTEARSASVRDTLSSILSARLGYQVGSGSKAIQAASDKLMERGEYGDEAVASRVSAGLKSLSFNPEAERQRIASGGVMSQEAIAKLGLPTLALREPLSNISGNTKEANNLLIAIRDNLEKRALVEEQTQLNLQSQGLRQQMEGPNVAQEQKDVLLRQIMDKQARVGQIDELLKRSPKMLGEEVAAPIAKSMVEAAKEAGVVMGEAFVVSSSKGGGGSLFQGFGTGFQNALEGSVLQGRFSTIEEALSSLEDVGERVGTSLEQNLGNAFGDFVTGAQKGKDAFRSFVLGVLNDSARAFASKAVQQLLGMILSAYTGVGSVDTSVGSGLSPAPASFGGKAAGGFIGMAAGGKVPAMLMNGEYVFGPSAAQRLGPSMLKGLNNGTIRKMAGGGALVTGGSGLRDDVPAMLAPGSFVVRKAMTERYGTPMLSALANGGTVGFNMGGIASEATTVTMRANALAANTPMVRMAGGGFAAMPFVGFEDGGAVMSAATPVPITQGGGGGVFQIGVTINDNSTTTTSSQQSAAGSPLADKQLGETLAQRMRQVALQTIEEQTRMGGMLRKQSIRNQ